VEKTYSNNNRAKAPEVLCPMQISSLFYLQNVQLFHNIGIYIHRSFTYFMKVTPPIYQLRIAIQYTSGHHPPIHQLRITIQCTTSHLPPLASHLSVKNCNTVHKNPEAKCLSRIQLGYVLRKPVSSRGERFFSHR
jgi:hypothetical protein